MAARPAPSSMPRTTLAPSYLTDAPAPNGNGTTDPGRQTLPKPAVEPRTVTRLLAAAGVRQVRLEFADLHGVARSKLIPLDRFPSVLERGVEFYGGALHWDINNDGVPARYWGGTPVTLPDYVLVPDLSTLAVLSHAPGSARVLCDLHCADGAAAPWAPRTVVHGLMDAYAVLGYRVRLGFEYEFFLWHADGRPVFGDRQYAATQRNLCAADFVDAVHASMPALGIDLANFHVEAAPGQLEVTFDAACGLAAMDQAFSFKTTVKELAAQLGYRASFITKPAIDEACNALHVHQSLQEIDSGVNAFADGSGRGLSALGRHYLAGQMEHARASCAFLAPTVNCYKSYQPHTFSPINVSWGYDNRQTAIRIPAAYGAATRIENRLGGAAADPYIAAIALLASGLDGIRRRLEPPPPTSGDPAAATGLAPLPTRLDEAAEALVADATLSGLIEAPFLELYSTVKRHEADMCRAACGDYDETSFHGRVDPIELAWYGDVI